MKASQALLILFAVTLVYTLFTCFTPGGFPLGTATARAAQ